MKKLTIMLLAVAAIVVMACKNDNTAAAVKEAKDVIDKAIENVEKATSLEEISQLGDQFSEDMDKIAKKYPDVELENPNDPQAKELIEAAKKFMDACAKKATDLTGSDEINDLVEGAKDELEQELQE